LKYKVLLEPEAIEDFQKAIDFYNAKRPMQGGKFKKVVTQHLNTLKVNPFFAIRYDDIRCLPVKKYPYLIHFTILEDENKVEVHAISHTSQNNPSLIE